MSCLELIEALRRQGEENILAVRREAEAEAERIRAEASKKIGLVRESLFREHMLAVAKQAGEIISAAERKARMILLSSGRELSEKLYAVAAGELCCLRNGRYPEIFDALFKELPAYQWQVVRVNPLDEGRAGELFPGAAIMTDPAITAGLEVEGRDGMVRIVNTFEKRLDKAWAEILPELIRYIYGRIGEPGAAEKN